MLLCTGRRNFVWLKKGKEREGLKAYYQNYFRNAMDTKWSLLCFQLTETA